MKVLLIYFILILSSFTLNAQKIEYLFTVKAGLKQEIHKLIFDTGNELLPSLSKEDAKFMTGFVYTTGLEMRKKNYVADINFSFHEYETYISRVPTSFDGASVRSSSSYNSFDLLFAGGYRIMLFKNRIAFTPSVGIGGSYHDDFSLDYPGSGSSKSMVISNSGEIIDSYEAEYLYANYTRWNIYTHANLEMDLNINPYLSLFFSLDFTGGLFKVQETNVEYYLQQEPTQYNAQYVTNGSYFTLNGGLKFPLNWIWSKKEK